MILSRDEENTSGKIQLLFIIKDSQQARNRRASTSPTTNMIPNEKRLNAFSLRSSTR